MLSVGRSLSKPPPLYNFEFAGSALINGNKNISRVVSDATTDLVPYDVGSYTEKDYSLQFWWKRLTDDTSNSTIDVDYKWFDFGHSGQGGIQLVYYDYAGDNEKITMIHRNDSGDSSHYSSDVDHNVWYHVVYTYDGSATTGKIYLNGSLDTTHTSMVVPGPLEDGVMTRSQTLMYADSDNNCNLCEMAFWKEKVLSATDVSNLYNSGNGLDARYMSSDNLVGYWKLDPSNTTDSLGVKDYSTTGFDMTATAGITFGTTTP